MHHGLLACGVFSRRVCRVDIAVCLPVLGVRAAGRTVYMCMCVVHKHTTSTSNSNKWTVQQTISSVQANPSCPNILRDCLMVVV